MAEPKRTRIQDVAERAGVSMMTVSRVLNQDQKVSSKTREKVMAVVKELNYRPNVSARRLASSKSFFLGLLYDNPSDSYISQFLLAALKKCRALGYHLVVDEAHLDINKTIESVKQLIDVTQVDGMILLPPMCDNEEVLEVLTKANVPYVRITPDTKLNSSPYICMDDYQAAFEVTERLINQGHKKIAHIIGNNKQGVSRLRYQGYLDALRSNKIITPPEYIEQGSFTYQSGMEAAVKLLALDEKPTAIFAANDDMAAAVISIAQQQGINIPDELSVVGFDDTQLAKVVWPHISTVKQPINEMAELSVSLLASGQYNDLSNLKSLDLRHILDFELIERESSSITQIK
ncbi:LacI family DNA-binding transcriptional regulator [Pseudoalteromonas sp. ZZD1]|uniref:LacI family DNA-binding transcriptional regulator n=1 Tax=Pseudoalteromonas sp. ZZD1 TaxID=3139395 RepID=UPI003BAD9818